MLSALQSRLVVRESSNVREFPTEESSPLLSLPQGTEIFGLGKAVSDSSWTYVSIEGVPLGYVPTANLGEREVSRGQTGASVPSGDELDRLQERRRLNRSPDLDLRLATALDDVIADRTFDGPPLEIAGESLVQGNAGTDDGISPNGRGERQSGRLADAQATRGAESIDSTQAPALPASDDSEDCSMSPPTTKAIHDV